MQSPYQLKEKDEFSYEFVTDQSIIYSIYFMDYNFIFQDILSIAENIYTINIDVIEGDIYNSKEDERIGITIIEIFHLFFKDIKNAIIYVCDSNDNRHYARKKKFDSWFTKYNDGTILKEDGIALVENVKILNSLLVSLHNPNLNEIIKAFKKINSIANEK